ncbi:hypothetical protein TrLO_g12841 [Triparma laevis f. longispina]|uniref:Uncharacterized protein n=1 Tax=Triparma laevis f. longispina TaxID=1714387 RepID=A0A9W7KZ41_9STRA|nr:hypothetical protein TrLO_g12841 [Triparma laevis f. longispina]
MSLAPTESLPSTGLDLFVLCAHTSLGRGFANALLRVKFDAVTSTTINTNSHGESISHNLGGDDDILTYAEMMGGGKGKRQKMNDYDDGRAGLDRVEGRGLGGRVVKESLEARHVRIGSEFLAGRVGEGVGVGGKDGMKIRVDYLCILLSMRDKASLELARDCLRKIHCEYITLRKVCVVVTDFGVDKGEYAFPLEELEALLGMKCGGVKDKIFCVRSDFEAVLRGAQQAGRKGKKGGISPLFFTTL